MLCDACTSAHVHGLSADKLGLEGRLAVLEEHGDDLGGVGDSGDTVLNRSRVWYCVPGTPRPFDLLSARRGADAPTELTSPAESVP
jgi:hypothetical protein